MNNSNLMDGDIVLLQRDRGAEWKRGVIQTHEELTFFVGDEGFTYAICEGDLIKKEGTVSVKLIDVPVKYRYCAKRLGITLTAFAMMAMEKEYEKIKGRK